MKFTKGMIFKWSIKGGTRYAEITTVGENLLYLRIINDGIGEIFVNKISWTKKVLNGEVTAYMATESHRNIKFGEQQKLYI